MLVLETLNCPDVKYLHDESTHWTGIIMWCKFWSIISSESVFIKRNHTAINKITLNICAYHNDVLFLVIIIISIYLNMHLWNKSNFLKPAVKLKNNNNNNIQHSFVFLLHIISVLQQKLSFSLRTKILHIITKTLQIITVSHIQYGGTMNWTLTQHSQVARFPKLRNIWGNAVDIILKTVNIFFPNSTSASNKQPSILFLSCFATMGKT